MTQKTYIPPEVLQLMELGRQKKLWALEIVYTTPGENEAKRIWQRNMTSDKLMDFREKMFRYGFTVPVEPGHWKIVCPLDIQSVDLYRQDAYVMEPYNAAIQTGQPTG